MNKHEVNTSSNNYDILNNLNKYMLTETILNNFNKISHKKNIVIEKKTSITLDNVFFPDEKDQLFWCFYVLQHGMDNYHLRTSRY